MTSVERVLDYCSVDQEPAKTSDKPPSPEWPNRGAITFTKTSLKYSDKAPLILKNIECHIKGKEKVIFKLELIFYNAVNQAIGDVCKSIQFILTLAVVL